MKYQSLDHQLHKTKIIVQHLSLNYTSQLKVTFDLIKDLELSKSKAEMLGSRLQQWNLLAGNEQISHLCDHYKNLVPFFLMDGDLVYCNDIHQLQSKGMEAVY